MPLIAAFEATDQEIEIKFDTGVRVTTITNDKFSLLLGDATPVSISNPFETININNDYDTIARRLVLKFRSQLTPSSSYTFHAAGLLDPAGIALPPATYTFSTGVTVGETLPEVTESPPVVIEDHSVRSEAFLVSEVIYASNPDFYIIETDPEQNEFMIDSDRNSGRVTIKFSARPGAQYLTSNYFKAQSKVIQRAPNRWKDIDVQISLDASRPWVYIDFPSTDATPVFGDPDKDYFSDGAKYRIRVSKDVAAA